MVASNLYQHIPRPASLQMDGAEGGVLIHKRFANSKLERALNEHMERLSEVYAAHTGVTLDLTKLPRDRQRMLSVVSQNIIEHVRHCVASGRLDILAKTPEFRAMFLKESTGTADVAAYTTQQLVFAVDQFAMRSFDFLTQIPMTGPTAYVHRMLWEREDTAGFYTAGADLVDGLDPTYTECPTECTAANGIDLQVTSETVTAECRRLAATYCIPANWHMSSQYGRELPDMLELGLSEELARTTHADVVETVRANAGNTITSWTRTPAGGSVWESLNINEWKRELWQRVKTAQRNILLDPDGRVPAMHIVGDVAGIGVLEDAVPTEFVPFNADLLNSQGDAKSNFFDTVRAGQFMVHRVIEGLPEDTLIVLARDDADPTYVYAPWIPITALQPFEDPEQAQVKLGAITLYGQSAIRSGRIEEIDIGA